MRAPIVLLLLCACAPVPAPDAERADAGPSFGVVPSPATDLILAEERACTAPADCTLVEARCCACTNASGALAAVNAAAVDAIEARRAQACDGFGCFTALSSEESCCAQGTACIDGRCELVGPRGTSIIVDCE